MAPDEWKTTLYSRSLMNEGVSVVTATYNRAHTLTRLFDSLADSASVSEWIVVDDGSTDETEALIQSFSDRAQFPIRYVRQPNQGRNVGLNAAIQLAQFEYTIIQDSDDWFTPGGLAVLVEAWRQIPPNDRPMVCAVVGLCEDQNGRIIGTRFPGASGSFVEMRERWKVRGDKKELFRTEVLREFPFPIQPGERRIPTSLILGRMSQRYVARFVNSVVTGKEYLSDGLSARLDGVRMRSPNGSLLRYKEYLEPNFALPAMSRYRNAANYVRYSLHASHGLIRQIRDVPARIFWIAAFPVGFALFVRDRSRARSSK